MLCAGNDGRAAVFCLRIILRYFMEMKYNLRTAAFYIIIIQTYVLDAWLCMQAGYHCARRQPGMYGNYFLRIRENDWKIERLLCYNQKDVMKRVRGAYLLWVFVLVIQTKHLELSGEVSYDEECKV